MSDHSRKTLRSFYCRDYLWDLFEVMTRDLGCSMDYLINESMRHYARSRNYSFPPGTGGPEPRGPQAPAAPAPAAPAYGAPQPGYAAPPAAPAPPAYAAPPAPPAPPAYPAAQQGYNGRQDAQQTFQRMPAVPPRPTQTFQRPPAPPAAPPAYSAPPAYAGAPPAQSWRAPAPAPPPPPVPTPAPAPPTPAQAPQAAGGAQARPRLTLIFNNQRYPVEQDKFIIGRGSTMTDLTIRDGNISRKHAAVIYRNGGYYIKDLDSTNGIDYRGNRIDSKKIEEGDTFNICDYEFRFTYQ